MILSLAEFCDNTSRGLLTSSFLGKIFLVLKICIPIILIIWGTIDMVKAVMNPDDKKNYQKIVKRFIYAALIFFIPTVASFIFNLIDQKETKCLQCFLDPYQKSCEYIELKHEEYKYEPKPQEEIEMPENNDEDNTMNCKAHFDGAIPNNNKEFANTTIAYGQKDNLFEPSIFNDILTEGKYEIIDDKIMPDGLIYNYIVNTIKYTPDSLVLGNHTKIEIYLNDEKIFEEVGPKIFVLDRFRRFDEIYNLNEFSPKPVKDEDRISYTSDYIYKLAKNSYENIFELYPSDVNKRIYKEFGYENMYFSYEYLYTVGYDFLFKINNISAFDDLLIIISCV